MSGTRAVAGVLDALRDAIEQAEADSAKLHYSVHGQRLAEKAKRWRQALAVIGDGTPSSRWAANGEPDPHGNRYDCERAALAMGDMTDDELANAVFLHGDSEPSIADLASGKAILPIAYLTAAKDRIRWLSRRLVAATASKEQPAAWGGDELVAKLQRSLHDLGEHRQTHVVWRDWLLKDPANEQVNPHAGSAGFHDDTIKDYDRHLANIAEAIARLASTGSAPAPSAVPVAYRYRRRGLGGAWRFGTLELRNPDRTIARPTLKDPAYEYELLAVAAAPTQEPPKGDDSDFYDCPSKYDDDITQEQQG